MNFLLVSFVYCFWAFQLHTNLLSYHKYTKERNEKVKRKTLTKMYAQRRKKKRSSNRIYRVDLERGSNGGFGFSISGEKPCSVSCVVKTSPVFGILKSGDYLIAVKDLETDGKFRCSLLISSLIKRLFLQVPK